MIVLGRLTAPYGVRGWFRLHPFGDDPATWRSMPQWWLSPDDKAKDESWVVRPLRGLRAHGRGWLVAFEDCDDRTAAEALVGQYVGAPRAALPDAGQDQYYWADLVGMAVINRQGQSLGMVASLIETGANTVLVVREGERERLLPFVSSVIDAVDVAAGVVRADWQSDW